MFGTQATARDYKAMHGYLLRLHDSFVLFFLNNKVGDTRLRKETDLGPARKLYEWLR